MLTAESKACAPASDTASVADCKSEKTDHGKLSAMPPDDTEHNRNRCVQVIGAGRTDAGVHAKSMTANVFLDTKKAPEELQAYLNTYLPEDISADHVSIASPRFHSRFNAIGKTYCYTCYCGAGKPVFDRNYVTVLPEKPDVGRMRLAAEALIGSHDFKAFCGNPKMKKPTVRRLDEIEITEEGDYLRIRYRGNGFLQNMVRILTGTLLEVGFGRMEPEAIPAILDSKDRSMAGPTAPAAGLCLMEVHYD
jgi:tRNA pseudouridine38-40 synthase